MHNVHSHVEAFCFSTMALNELSAAIGAAKADAGAATGADVLVSVFSVEGKMVENCTELVGFCESSSLALSQLADDNGNVLESFFGAFPKVNEVWAFGFDAKLPNENVDATLGVFALDPNENWALVGTVVLADPPFVTSLD